MNKNIHIIPTDKPSRLWVNNLRRRLELDSENLVGSNTAKHIFITSDEEIKEGDWVLSGNKIYQIKESAKDFLNHVQGISKKIILTTDQDLIKDGVQAIDDEFLEWFMKNPACEEVKIEDYGNLYNFRYLVLIPKEEPKQEVTGVDDNRPKPNYCYAKEQGHGEIGCVFPACHCGLPIKQEEPKQIKCYCGHTITCDCEPLQETLEEAAEMYIQSKNPQWTPYHKQSFKDGAKWKQERMEEDMINFAHFYFKEEFNSTMQTNKSTKELLSEWFEQNKNK